MDDLKCDEMGCWECVSVKKVSEKKYHKEDGFKLTRRYYSNGSFCIHKENYQKIRWQQVITDKNRF